jgi:subtilase family serine protease
VNDIIGRNLTFGTSDNQFGGFFTHAKFDEIRIWNVARSESQINEKMNTELIGIETGLVAYYRMNYLGTGGEVLDNSDYNLPGIRLGAGGPNNLPQLDSDVPNIATQAITYSWTGGNDNWSNQNAWTPVGIPGEDDTAIIGNGVCTLDVDKTIAYFQIVGGTLEGTASPHILTVTGNFDWLGGNLKGTGDVAVFGATAITGTGDLVTRKLTLNGGGTITGGASRSGGDSGELFVPLGQSLDLNIISTVDWYNLSGGGVLNIAGTLNFTGPIGNYYGTYNGFPGWAVLCTGTMNVTGNLHFGYFGYNGTFTGANIDIAAGSYLYFTGGLHTFNDCTITGEGRIGSNYPGDILFQAGNQLSADIQHFEHFFTINHDMSIGDVFLYGGTLNGTGNITIPILVMSGGTLAGTGLKTVTDSIYYSYGSITAPMKFAPNGSEIGAVHVAGSYQTGNSNDFDIDIIGNQADKVTFTNNVHLSSFDNIHLFPGTPVPSGLSYVVLECAGNLSGTFGPSSTIEGFTISYDYTPGAGKVILNQEVCTLSLTPTPVAATCVQSTDGTINLNVIGGSGSYEYDWSGPNGFTSTNQSLTGLAPGVYMISVVDTNNPGCYSSESVTVDTTNILAVTISADPPWCAESANGQLSADVTGCAVCIFDYEWHNTGNLIGTLPILTGLSVGTYEFSATTVINGNLCSVTENGISLMPAYDLLATANVTAHVACDALPIGSVTLTGNSSPAGNSYPPFTFDIGNGYATEDELMDNTHVFSALAGGYYNNVSITDAHGCQGTATFAIAGPETALSVSSTNTLICNNTPGNLDLILSGGIAPFEFAWSNGATTEDLAGILPGIYDVNINYDYTAGIQTVSCQSTETITVASAGAEPQISYSYAGQHLVSPLVGDPYTDFHFEIIYTDADNDPPMGGFPKLYLDKENDGNFERTIAMNPVNPADQNYAGGKAYFVEPLGLTAGTAYHSYMTLRDESGCESKTDTLDEPDILYLPDVYIFANDISFLPAHPEPGEAITVNAIVHNPSDFDTTIVVRLESEFTSGDADYNNQFPADIAISIPKHGSSVATWSIFTPSEVAFVPIHVTADATDIIMESNELDNSAVRPFLNGEYNLPVDIELDASVSVHSVLVNCYSDKIYRLNCSNIRYTGLPPGVNTTVSGAQVTFVWQGETLIGNTDDNGNFSVELGRCSNLGLGNYDVTGIEVTDFTVTSEPGLVSFEVFENDCGYVSGCSGGGGGSSGAPDYVGTVNDFPAMAVVGQQVSGTFSVNNVGAVMGTGTSTAELQVIGAGAPNGLIETTSVLAVSQTEAYPANLTFNTPGLFGLVGIADANWEIYESNESNNSNYPPRSILIIPAEADLQPLTELPVSETPLQCKVSNLTFKVTNFGNASASDFNMHLEIFKLSSGPADSVLEASYDQTVGNVTGFQASGNTTTKIFQHQFLQSGQYLLRITADNGEDIAEYLEDNNTRDFKVNVGECEGDLVVSSTCENFLVSPASPVYPGNITINTRIKNTGPNQAFGPFKVKFIVNGITAGIYNYNGTLNANQELPISKQIAMPDPTMANILEIIVDSDNNVPEPLEDNNSWTTDLSTDLILNIECNENPNAPPPAPQTISYVGRFWENIVPVFSPQNLWVRFKNEGNIRRSNVKVRYEMSGPGITGWQLLGDGTTPLAVKPCDLCNNDGTIPMNTNFLSEPVEFSQAGTFLVRMTIDPDNVYAELDESLASNQLIVEVVAQNIPDMRTLSQYIAPSLLNPDPGEQVDINITFDNQGQYNLQDSFNVRLLIDDVPVGNVRTAGLAQGDHRTVAMPPWSTVDVGGHVMRAVIDADDEIAEANENNNEATRIIFVGESPNLRFLSFTVDNPNPGLGDLVTFSAEIENQGDLTGIATLKLYYQDEDCQQVEFYSGSITVAENGTLSLSSIITWPAEVAFTVITAKISACIPEEYTIGDNEATLTLNGLNFTVLTNPVTCVDNGSASISGLPLAGNYTISWFLGEELLLTGATIENLAAGTYMVKVYNNCVFSAESFTINTSELTTYYPDEDGDGYGDPASSINTLCPTVAFPVTDNTDCRDDIPAINPGASEACNNIDDDCDLNIDEGLPTTTYYQDNDHDGKGNPAVSIVSCSQPVGYVANNTDCDDNSTTACPKPSGMITTDITDMSATVSWNNLTCATRYRLEYRRKTPPVSAWTVVYPTTPAFNISGLAGPNILYQWRVATICSPNGTAAESGYAAPVQSFYTRYRVYPDEDLDGFGNDFGEAVFVSTFPQSGFSNNQTDCDDTRATAYPGAPELCNGLDDDCDLIVDEGANWYQDADGDGLGNAAVFQNSCLQPPGYVSNQVDCNDNSTVAVCSAPTGVMASNTGITFTTISWTGVSCASGYTVMYRVLNTSNFYPQFNTTGNVIMLNGLLPGTTYQVRVRSKCPPPNTIATSGWVYITFTTQAAPLGLVEGGNEAGAMIDPANMDFDIYPNPGSDIFNVRFNSTREEEIYILILDGIGRQVFAAKKLVFEGQTIEQLDLSLLTGGIYHLQVQQGDMVRAKKLVIVR